MSSRLLRAASSALIVLTAAACGPQAAAPSTSSSSAGPSASVGVSALPLAATFEAYQVAFCSSFTSLVRAVGNPDTNSPSVMSKRLDDAVKAHDVATARDAAAAIIAELETGRRQAAVASGWQPGQASSVALDRVLVAFEANITARAAMAAPGASADPQAAFEQAGGPGAWGNLLASLQAVPVPSGSTPTACKAFTGSI